MLARQEPRATLALRGMQAQGKPARMQPTQGKPRWAALAARQQAVQQGPTQMPAGLTPTRSKGWSPPSGRTTALLPDAPCPRGRVTCPPAHRSSWPLHGFSRAGAVRRPKSRIDLLGLHLPLCTPPHLATAGLEVRTRTARALLVVAVVRAAADVLIRLSARTVRGVGWSTATVVRCGGSTRLVGLVGALGTLIA